MILSEYLSPMPLKAISSSLVAVLMSSLAASAVAGAILLAGAIFPAGAILSDLAAG